ncbi:MAG: hypothetical protein FJ272_13770 [Planctomycetes bacterium]|nr:hypothetical protein [Planctomycetota bacterium]
MPNTDHLPSKWLTETILREVDPAAGAVIRQLTCQSTMATSIYCEDPFCSQACNRLIVLRSENTHLAGPVELWIIDLRTQRSRLVDPDASAFGLAQHAYADEFFYFRVSDAGRQLLRLRLSTLEVAPVFSLPPTHPGYSNWGSMSPDARFYVNLRTRASGETSRVAVLDLQTGQETVIAEGDDLFNPHPRFDRMKGEHVLVQHNRGQRLIEDGRVESVNENMGPTLFLVRRDGTGRRDLPISQPYIPVRVSGHEAWIKGQPEIVLSLIGPYDDGHRVGNLIACRIGDERPRVLAHAPTTYYGHVSTSCCGLYWVCDAWEKGSHHPTIAVGGIESGKFRTLCAVGGGTAHFETGHAHPYMTPDNRFVIFGSTRAGLAQVFSAQIPAGFLDSLR